MKVIRFNKHQFVPLTDTVITIGSFDGVHLAHQTILRKLKAESITRNCQSVVITFDPHPRNFLDQNNSTQTLTTIDEKIELLSEHDIDLLIIAPFNAEFAQLSPREYIDTFLIRYFNPKAILIGYDHRFGQYGAGDIHLLREYEKENIFEIIQFPIQTAHQITISSTEIRTLIAQNKFKIASQLLGRNYSISGKVVKGQQIGSELGYPTANIEITDQSKLIPNQGIYAAIAKTETAEYDAMLYIGNRPSIGNNLQQTIEVHFFNFNETIYGKTVSIELVEYVREDKKLTSWDELKIAIKKDEVNIKKILDIHHLHRVSLKKNPRTVIAILNYNGLSHLKENLHSIIKYSPHDVDIYVIDNASTDESVTYIKENYPQVKLIILKSNYGYAEGYNKGLAQISADYFVLVNSDVWVDSDWITPLVQCMKKNPNCLAAQPKILSLKEKDYFEYAGAAGGFMDSLYYPFNRGRIMQLVEKDEAQYDTEIELFWASGAAFIVNARAFKVFGGFDGDYFAHQEEIDLCWRFKNAGGKILFTPDSKVYHLGGGTLAYESPNKLYLNFRNNLSTIFKNADGWRLFYILPIRLILDLLILIQYLVKGKPILSYKIMEAYIVSILSTFYLLHKKDETDQLCQQFSMGDKNKKGLLKGSIFLHYYLFSNKKYSQIHPQNFIS